MKPITPHQKAPQTLLDPEPTSRKKASTISTIIILVLIGLSAYLGYQNIQLKKQIVILSIPTTAPSPTPHDTITSSTSAMLRYSIGNFTFSANNDYIYENDLQGKKYSVERSDATLYNGTNGPCYRISNIDFFHTPRKIPALAQSASPSISIISWNDNQLKYSDEASKTQFQTWVQQLLNLYKYTNISFLEKTVFDPNYGKSFRSEPNINAGQFLYCSGIYSYPLSIDRVYSKDFMHVFFINVLEGNGTFSTPTKALVIHHGNDWLIFKERPIYEPNDYFTSCNKQTTHDSLVCVDKLWKEKYRDVSDEQKWINQTLSSIKLAN